MKKNINVLLLGAPGSGKGTVASFITEEYNLPSLSTGNIAKAESKKGTELGKKLDELTSQGKFFSDEIAVSIAKIGLDEMRDGVILDGFPRNLTQTKIFEEYFKETNRRLDVVLHIVNSDKNIIERLKDRRACPNCGATYHLINKQPINEGICDICSEEVVQRKDDKPETIKERLETYRELTEPIVDFYKEKGIVRVVSSDCSIEEMFNSVKKIINSL